MQQFLKNTEFFNKYKGKIFYSNYKKKIKRKKKLKTSFKFTIFRKHL